LTDDLDKVSDELFKLKTAGPQGSQEYCGFAIDAAAKKLKWAESDKVMKAIFIAGNEPFTQGSLDPYAACSETIKKGVTVSTIYCGPFEMGVRTGWQKGSQLADGSYVAIDQDKPFVAISTPVDEKLVKLGAELNNTYLFYGSEESRRNRALLQTEQDRNAARQSLAAGAARAETKGGGLYDNSKFDLVDGIDKNEVKLEALRDAELPDQLKGKSLEEKKAFVTAQAEKRKAIQDQIQKLAAEREKFIVTETARQRLEHGDTLDSAVITTVREQAAKKKFAFPADAEPPKPRPSVTDEATGIVVTVKDDERTLVARLGGKILWQADVIKSAGPPGVGRPVVRHLSLKGGAVTAVYGKHSFAELELKTGKLLASGSD
jgi:hypothetical protein